MKTNLAVNTTTEKRIARPLAVLVPLIQDHQQHGKTAAAEAGMPYFKAAGDKLLEAKSQLPHGEFQSWTKRHFTVTYETLRTYMRFSEDSQKTGAPVFSSLSDHIRQTSNPNYNRPSAWHEPVKKIIDRVDTETLNLKAEEVKRGDEREAQRKLALQLIDIGFRVLAKTLHPDKGGSRAAMTRLNAVRDRLKQCI